MKRKIFLLAILLNYQYLIIATSDSCSTTFETRIEDICESFAPNDVDNQKCSFSNNKCQQVYKVSCTGYKVKSGETINNNICSLLPTSNLKKKCQANTNSDGCEEVDRKCEDYKGEGDISCEELKAEDDQHCVLSNNKCTAHYKKCDSIDNNDNNKCNNNLPLPTEYNPDNKYSKCEWKSTCEAVDRTCSEYKTYKAFLSQNGVNCKDLKTSDTTDTSLKCVLDNEECKEAKADCGDYKGGDQNVCNTYKPINQNSEVLSNFKCGIKDGECTQIQKTCSEYKEGEVKCNQLISSKEGAENKIICSLQGKNCVEKYATCGAYNDFVEEAKRSKNECEEIQPSRVEDTTLKTLSDDDPIHIKCYFDNDSQECKEAKKECTEMDSTKCADHTPLLQNQYKACYFKNSKCIEQFTTCENYQDHEDKDKQNSKDCIAIREDSPTQICVFTAKTGNSDPKCETVKKKCSEFSSDNFKNICTSIGSQCVYNNGACTTLIEKEKEEDKGCPKCECPSTSKVEDDNNSGNEKYLNKILIFITCLLL